MSYRQLTPEEERDDSYVRARWDEFMLTMQEAAVFVNTKTPLMTHQLEDTHKVYIIGFTKVISSSF